MSNQPLSNILLRHNTWATRVLLDTARSLDYKDFTQTQFDIGLKTIHDTLLHITGAMARWSDRLVDRKLRPSIENITTTSNPPQTAKIIYYTPDEIIKLLDIADLDLNDSVIRLIHEQRLNEYMVFPAADGDDTQDYRFTRGAAISHIITHGVHHRAQALNMLRQLKCKNLPELDVIEWEINK